MKKTIISTATILLSVFLLSSAGYSDIGDLPAEGTTMMEKAKVMMKKATMMTEFKGGDKVSMVDQGHLMIKEGNNMMHSGMMMNTTKGHQNLQEMGGMMMRSGRLLLDKGREKGKLTDEDIKKINKQGETMMGLARRMLEEGKMMGGK